MNSDLLFVYGTLMKDFDNEMSLYSKDNPEQIGEGYFHGELFDIGDYPGAVLNEKSEHRVYGDIFRIKNPDKVLKSLDEYEEVGEKFPKPNEYVRKIVTVYGDNNVTYNCWTYLYNLPTRNLKRISSGEYTEN